jgi:hypothetical protein
MHLRRHLLLGEDRPSATSASTGIAPTGLQRMMLDLQRSAGNSAVAALVAGGVAVQRDDDPSGAGTGGGGTARRSGLLDGKGLTLGDPEDFFARHPVLAPQGGLPSLPTDAVSGLIDWGDVGTAFADRRLVLQDRDRALVTQHYRRWFPVAQALYKLPLAARLFDSPAAIMNTMTAKAIDSSLAGSNLNMVEQFDREAARFGGESTGASFTVKRF